VGWAEKGMVALVMEEVGWEVEVKEEEEMVVVG
jgi:hypothetical protein